MLRADVLVILTASQGLLKDGQVLDVVDSVDDEVRALATGERSRLGSGGMASKLAAADLVTRAGEAVVIAGAREPNVLERLLAGEQIGTVFVPARRKLSSRRRWIGQAARTQGKLLIDDGAAAALIQKGKSLLPSGVKAVYGRFEKGATVAVIDSTGRQVARGLTNYSSSQIDLIKGLKTSQIAKALGPTRLAPGAPKPCDEIIHRNNMTLG
jgi:glutamate 5-kinase